WIGDWERFAGTDAVADQVRFEREWGALREYATARGVRILGDVAMYVSPDGCDQRTRPDLFLDGVVAGAPPDEYSRAGQLWGNPVYDWPALRRRGYRWWVARVRRTLDLFDAARLDHFRGFVSYWAVPEGASTAAEGRWRRGPGAALFRALGAALGAELPLIAEDLGVITPAVQRLRESLRLPGMLVLQFGLHPDHPRSLHAPANHVADRVVYTGTHDHDTARGWLESLAPRERAFVDDTLARRGLADLRRPWWSLIRLALSSPARLAMLQAQDVLGLGSEARLNVPGRATGNWRWRLDAGALSPSLARELRDATEEADRLAPDGACVT
ncbi:MAG: 4-alpha-glucanotransferase, partial [Solirubrobacteraceae bacterium]